MLDCPTNKGLLLWCPVLQFLLETSIDDGSRLLRNVRPYGWLSVRLPHSPALLCGHWLARAYEFRHEAIHSCFVVQLGPHEVNLFYLFFVLDQPPEPLSELLLHELCVVSFANIAFVIDIDALFIKLFLVVFHLFYSRLVDNLVIMLHIKIILRIEAILRHKEPVHQEEKLFFDELLIFSLSHGNRRKLSLRKIQAKSPGYFDCPRYVLLAVSFSGSWFEHDLNELVVVSQHAIYWVVLVHVIWADILQDFYLSYWPSVGRSWRCRSSVEPV